MLRKETVLGENKLYVLALVCQGVCAHVRSTVQNANVVKKCRLLYGSYCKFTCCCKRTWLCEYDRTITQHISLVLCDVDLVTDRQKYLVFYIWLNTTRSQNITFTTPVYIITLQ